MGRFMEIESGWLNSCAGGGQGAASRLPAPRSRPGKEWVLLDSPEAKPLLRVLATSRELFTALQVFRAKPRRSEGMKVALAYPSPPTKAYTPRTFRVLAASRELFTALQVVRAKPRRSEGMKVAWAHPSPPTKTSVPASALHAP